MVLCNDLEGPVDIALWEYAKQQMTTDPQDLVDRVAAAGGRAVHQRNQVHDHRHHRQYVQRRALQLSEGRARDRAGDVHMIAPEQRNRILAQVDQWAGEGLRLLGLAYRARQALWKITRGYTWVGLVGMEDPIREGVQEAVQVAQRAGIQVKMITGDYRRTAERIARNIGLMRRGRRDPGR